MYVCMYVVLRCVYLSGTACGLVLPFQFGCRRCVAASSRGMLPCMYVCMYVCMYGQQVHRSYTVVVFCRPDLT